jgi:predicted transcriptional regulator
MPPGLRADVRQQRAQREEDAWKLRLRGRTEREIAQALGVSQPSVHAMLDRVEKRVLADAKALVFRIKARQHGRLEELYVEALAAYERSKGEAVRSVTEGTPGERGVGVTPTKVRREAQGRDGDPAWLNVLLAIHDRLVALWGLNAPVRTAPPREPAAEETLTDAALLVQAERELAEERRRLSAGRDEEGAA